MLVARIKPGCSSPHFPENLGHLPEHPQQYLDIEVSTGLYWLRKLFSIFKYQEYKTHWTLKNKGLLFWPFVFVVWAVIFVTAWFVGSYFSELFLGGAYKKYGYIGSEKRFTLGFLLTGSVLIILGVIWLMKRRIFTVRLYLLSPNHPFPPVNWKTLAKNKLIMAVRLLDPNVTSRITSFARNTKKLTLTFSNPIDLSQVPPAPKQNIRLLLEHHLADHSLAAHAYDFWPIIRLAVDRMLYRGLHDDFENEGLPGVSFEVKASGIRRYHLYMAYKLHILQLALFAALFGIATIMIGASLVEAHDSQLPTLLATLGLFWALLSSYLHRRQHDALLKWAHMWSRKPLGNCPFFLFDGEYAPDNPWEEIHDHDFGLRFSEFGLDNEKLLNLLVTGLLVVYLAYLHVIK